MKTPIDLDALKSSEYRELHWLVSRAVGQTSGVHEVDISTLPTTPAARFNLAQWASLHLPVTTKDMEAIQAHARAVATREEAELKRVTDESRGIARLQQHCNEQGLEETPENLAAVKAFIDASPVKGYWSEQIVDAAVANLGPRGTNQLTWKPKEAPPAPEPPPEPAEVLGTLPNGERQLPLDVPPTNRASKEQAKDWLTRTREATGEYVRPRGSFGSKF
jgi:hypothetical protein